MNNPAKNFIGLLLSSPEEEKLWRGALASQRVVSEPIARGPDFLRSVCADPRMKDACALMADAPVLLDNGIAVATFAAAILQRFPQLAIFVRLPSRTGISASEQAWARNAGIRSLLPGSSVAAWRESLAPVLERVLASAGHEGADMPALEAFINASLRSGDEPRSGPIKDAHQDARHLEANGINAARAYEALSGPGGVGVEDRAYRGKVYSACFVASEAIDCIAARFGVRRETALRACTFLVRTGKIHHVVRDAPFGDGFLFFRLAGARDVLDRIDLAELQDAMGGAGGVEISDRTHLAKTYSKCFIGSDAAAWLMKRHGLSLGAAEALGQRLLELGVFHHVLDEHGFVDGKLFYRFRADEVAVAV